MRTIVCRTTASIRTWAFTLPAAGGDAGVRFVLETWWDTKIASAALFRGTKNSSPGCSNVAARAHATGLERSDGFSRCVSSNEAGASVGRARRPPLHGATCRADSVADLKPRLARVGTSQEFLI